MILAVCGNLHFWQYEVITVQDCLGLKPKQDFPSIPQEGSKFHRRAALEEENGQCEKGLCDTNLRAVWESIHDPAPCGASPVSSFPSIQSIKAPDGIGVLWSCVCKPSKLQHLRPLWVLWLYCVLNSCFLTQSCKFQVFIAAS